MSRIKTEIDKALEHYGDQATVFRVVRRAVKRAWARTPVTKSEMDWLLSGIVNGKLESLPTIRRRYRKRYIHHIRRLLPIDRPVTTERLKIYSNPGVQFMMAGGISDSTDPWVQGALAGGPSDMSGLREMVEKLERGESLGVTLEEAEARIENGEYNTESEVFGD